MEVGEFVWAEVEMLKRLGAKINLMESFFREVSLIII